MEFKKLKENENKLLKRKEVQVSVSSESIPSYQELEKLIHEKFSVSQDSIAVKKVHSKFGSKTFIIDAFIYSSKDDKDKIEPKKKEKKKA